MELNLSNNKLFNIDIVVRAIQGLQYLLSLDLSRNKFSHIKTGTFVNLSLVKLDLRNMKDLFFIDKFAISNLSKLVFFEISNCPNLKYIHPNAIGFTQSLQLLDLSNNPALQSVPLLEYSYSKNITVINLKNSTILCKCEMLRYFPPLVQVHQPRRSLASENKFSTGRGLTQVTVLTNAQSMCLHKNNSLLPLKMFASGDPSLCDCIPRTFIYSETNARKNKLFRQEDGVQILNLKKGNYLRLICRSLASKNSSLFWIMPDGLIFHQFLDESKRNKTLTTLLNHSISATFLEFGIDIYFPSIYIENSGIYKCISNSSCGFSSTVIIIKVN